MKNIALYVTKSNRAYLSSSSHSRNEPGNILSISHVAVPQGGTFRKKTENIYVDAQCINTVRDSFVANYTVRGFRL